MVSASAGRVRRVTLVVPHLDRGGAETVIVLLARALALRGVATQCICLERLGAMGERLQREGGLVESLDSTKGYDLDAIRRLAGFVRRHRADVINIHDRTSLPYVMLAKALGPSPPVVLSAHGFLFGDSFRKRLRYRLPARWLAAMTAESRSVAARFAEHLGWRGQIDVIPNGVPVVERMDSVRQATRERLGVPPDAFVFFSVGNARPEKGFEDLLDATKRLRDRAPGARFAVLIVGAVSNDRYHEALLAQHRKLDLAGEVRFLGFQKDIGAVYQAADAYVLPSRSEGMPMVILEAMMYSLPIIATRVGALPDIVTPETGVLVEPRTPAALAQAMFEIMTDPRRCLALGQGARRRALAEYTVDRMTSRYLDLFERTVRESSPGPRTHP